MLEILNFDISVKSAFSREYLSIIATNNNVLVNLKITLLKINGVSFSSSQAEGISILTFLEFEWQDSHADQVRSVDSFEWLGDHNLNSL